MKRHFSLVIALLLLLASRSLAQVGTYESQHQKALDRVKAGEFDNGRMWTFDYPPLEYWNATYNFSPDRTWLEEVRKAALRFADYCSASFVSGDGLVMTNYHCGIDAVKSVTREGEDLLTQGFYAQTIGEERKVDGLFVDQLMQILDVTGEIQQAMDGAADPEAAMQRKKDVISEVEHRLGDQSGLRCQVVELFNGGRYSAYLYKRYSDVRLVFATELPFAFFGGIWDFWSYPRYAFDFDLFRVYDDNGAPLKSEHFFHWSSDGPKPGEPVFVVGNPGRTGRLRTVSQLEYQRDLYAPFVHTLLKNRKDILEMWLHKHPEERGELFDDVFGVVNGEEAYRGRLVGLRDDELMQRRRVFNRNFKAAVDANPELKEKYGSVFSEIDDAVSRQRELAPVLYGLRSQGLGVAEHISRAAALVTYALHMESGEKGPTLEMMEARYAVPMDTPMEIETMTLERQLELMRDILGADNEVVRILLDGRSAEQAAKTLVSESTLRYEKTIKALLKGAPASILESDKPFIRAMLLAVPTYEEAAKESGRLSAHIGTLNEELGRALFEVYGTEIPPDATFTLRISDGVLKQYEYNGTKAPMWTTFYGMYDRYYSFMGSNEAWDPMFAGNAFDLPDKWKTPPADFDLGTPYNFVSTCDIIGGNSGSPVINSRREVVGLAHDGNFESLPGEFIFAEDKGNRTIAVHSSGILAALRYIYRAQRIVSELENGGIQQ